MTKAIKNFSGEYEFLSNFYRKPVFFNWLWWDTSEHVYQALKCVVPAQAAAIRKAATPGKAKRMGAKCKLRDDWEDVKVDVMWHVLLCKFNDPDLRAALLATGDAHLEEGNTHGDRFWGTVDGVGENRLGQLLMKLRRMIRDGEL